MASRWARRVVALVFVVLACAGRDASAGAIFLTGHDSDFHAAVPPEYDGYVDPDNHNNAAGARRINQVAIDFILDPLFNPFFASGISKFLYVEADEADANLAYSPLLGLQGIVASGFREGVDFDQFGAPDLEAALDLLGTEYSGLVVASDCGGSLRQRELDILNRRSADIMDFLNAGGGLFAMSESNLCGPPDDPTNGITPDGGHFGFLPFVTSSTLNFDEMDPNLDLTLGLRGLGLGLLPSDITGNFAHNIFGGTFGMTTIDSITVGGRRVPVTLASRKRVTPIGVPEPGLPTLFACGLGVVLARRLSTRTRPPLPS